MKLYNGLMIKKIEGSESLIREDGLLIRKYKSREGYTETYGTANPRGYRLHTFKQYDKQKQMYVHRLVAEYFLDNEDNLPQVDHIDEDKGNNRVSNLRWCTLQSNVKFYHNQPTLLEKRKFLQTVTDREKKLEKNIQELHIKLDEKNKKILILETKINALNKSIDAIHEERSVYEEGITTKIITQRKEQEKILERNPKYQGYKDITGKKFESIEDLIKQTGKPVKVAGIQFPSAGAGATYIVSCEKDLGNIRNKATVSKEIRRYLQGKREAWSMYSRYSIGY